MINKINSMYNFIVIAAVVLFNILNMSAIAQTPKVNPCPDSVVYNSEVYKTVLITGQCWMKKNLNIGTMIDGKKDQTNNEMIEKYCYDNLPENCNAYGGLYQWAEMMGYSSKAGSQGICPAGWHIPTAPEWTKLEDNLGNFVAAKLKKGDISGFEGLMTGQRCPDGSFKYMNYYGYFWTSTEIDTKIAWYRVLLHNSFDFDAGSGNHVKTEGFSVRCLKD